MADETWTCRTTVEISGTSGASVRIAIGLKIGMRDVATEKSHWKRSHGGVARGNDQTHVIGEGTTGITKNESVAGAEATKNTTAKNKHGTLKHNSDPCFN